MFISRGSAYNSRTFCLNKKNYPERIQSAAISTSSDFPMFVVSSIYPSIYLSIYLSTRDLSPSSIYQPFTPSKKSRNKTALQHHRSTTNALLAWMDGFGISATGKRRYLHVKFPHRRCPGKITPCFCWANMLQLKARIATYSILYTMFFFLHYMRCF